VTASATDSAYRLDIQGLRALAVLLVFFSHAGWQPFGGGFIGVDVFFVISGYVITRFLLREYGERGTLSLRHFYARRLQRLLPALLVMVLVVSSLAILLMTRDERSMHMDAAANALFWVSNLFFYFAQVDYFDRAVGENLFLHTWTLGVEEQFYLVWPLVLLVGLAAPWRRALPALLVAVLLSTLLLCLYWAGSDPNAAFYLMPARGWQFAAGGLVAWWHQSGGRLRTVPLANLASLAGLALVLAAAALLDENSAYPRLNALAPTFGTALVLAGWGWCNRLLASPPVVWLGDVSYGFYLWHWPVLLIFADLKFFYPVLGSGLALALTVVLAAASYYLVEQPLRTNRRLLALPRSVIGGSLVTMVLAILLVHRLLAPLHWDEPSEVADIRRVAAEMPQPYLDGCDDWYHSDDLNPCVYGGDQVDETAVLIGDSVALQWFPAIEAIYRERGWRLIVLTKSACPIVDRSYFYAGIRSEYLVCDRWREQALDYIAARNPARVIISSYGDYPFSRGEWTQGTRDILGRLSPLARDIVLLAPSPALEFSGPDCLAREARLAQLLPIAPVGACESEYRMRPQLAGLEAVAGGFANVQWVDLGVVICPGGSCRARQGVYIAYRDRDHLTSQYVRSLVEQLAASLK
jgi:peptidoglycan/LPS O-acetylase OafA/YrhL